MIDRPHPRHPARPPRCSPSRKAALPPTLATEATARASTAVPAPSGGSSGPPPNGINIEYVEDHDMDGEEEITSATAELQEELDTLGYDHSGPRTAALPRTSGVTKQRLKGDKVRAAPSS